MRKTLPGTLPIVAVILLSGAFLLLAPPPAAPFPESSCGDQTCIDCHQITREEAAEILAGAVEGVEAVNLGDVPGTWEVVVRKGGRKYPVYLDFTKRFLITGEVYRLANQESLTRTRIMDLNRVDVSLIPTDDAILLGSPAAAHKIIVFDDPECPYCKQLFGEMKKVVATRPDIAFLIKMFPLVKIHPDAKRKSQAIVCAKSLAMLESSFADKKIPDPTCKTDAVDRTLELAARLGITSAPTLVFPDGRVVPGAAPADRIIETLGVPPPANPPGK
jgi:thiol:disulfide interchange protein DsbC